MTDQSTFSTDFLLSLVKCDGDMQNTVYSSVNSWCTTSDELASVLNMPRKDTLELIQTKCEALLFNVQDWTVSVLTSTGMGQTGQRPLVVLPRTYAMAIACSVDIKFALGSMVFIDEELALNGSGITDIFECHGAFIEMGNDSLKGMADEVVSVKEML